MFKKILALLAVCALVVGTAPISAVEPQSQQDSIRFVDAFPDENFRDFVMRGLENVYPIGRMETDKLTENDKQIMAAQFDLQIWANNIADLTGLEYFNGLFSLFISGNPITTLDISNIPNLMSLDVRGNRLGFNPVLTIIGFEEFKERNGHLSFYPQRSQDGQWRLGPGLETPIPSDFTHLTLRHNNPLGEFITVQLFFKDGKLVRLFTGRRLFTGSNEYVFVIPAPSDYLDWDVMRAFAWDGFQNMIPISSMGEINFSEIFRNNYN